MILGGEDRLNAQAGDLANVEVLDVLRDLREMRGRGFSMTGLTAEQRLRLLEVSRFESRVMAYIEGTAPLELQTNLDAARRYTSALTARGMTPLEAAQLTNYQPIAEVDLHTVCRCHFVLSMRHAWTFTHTCCTFHRLCQTLPSGSAERSRLRSSRSWGGLLPRPRLRTTRERRRHSPACKGTRRGTDCFFFPHSSSSSISPTHQQSPQG